LRKAAFVGNAAIVNFLADLQEGRYDPAAPAAAETAEFLRRLEILDAGPETLPVAPLPDTPAPTTVTLLLTTACNLRCAYCYAAAGDAPARFMPLETACRGIDFVVQNALLLKTGAFEVNFHGGGEPTRNWPIFTAAVAHARELAARHALQLTTYTATNGVLSGKQAAWIADNLDGASVSFDGLPEVHDANRRTPGGKGSSAAVMRTLRRFDETGFSYGIRMTVTAAMIPRFPDSIEFICSQFHPKQIQAEPSYQIGRWADAPSAETESFIAAYREAQARAAKHGYEISFSAARAGTLTNHFCAATQDLFALTPDGDVSACYEVFDNTNPRRNIFFYGMNDGDGGFRFDARCVAHLRHQSVENRRFCAGCFARWSCAGDCYHKALTVYGSGELEGTERCNIIRELTKDQLLALIARSGGVFWHEAPEGVDSDGAGEKCTCTGCN
jgi:uncharacterized protein